MFSNITDAWTNDPVKEITNRLSKGAFQDRTDHEKMFNFKNQNLLENNKRINDNDMLSLSENISLSLASENTNYIKSPFISDVSEYTTFAPANYDKYENKKQKSIKTQHHPSVLSINTTDTDTSNILDTAEDSKCSYSSKHLKKCDRCYYKLKKLVDNNINKKIEDIILDNKMKQLETFSQTQQLQKPTQSDSWKETLIIVIGAVIAILIILLIFKCAN